VETIVGNHLKPQVDVFNTDHAMVIRSDMKKR